MIHSTNNIDIRSNILCSAIIPHYLLINLSWAQPCTFTLWSAGLLIGYCVCYSYWVHASLQLCVVSLSLLHEVSVSFFLCVCHYYGFWSSYPWRVKQIKQSMIFQKYWRVKICQGHQFLQKVDVTGFKRYSRETKPAKYL